ncbi:MAG: hypothetical protein J6X11_09090 [Treponema sp.]|nr:hypothetical protein [Treponema sp.]
MKIFLRKFISFLLFLALGLAIDILLGLSIGTIFYLLRDKKLTEALGICFFDYFFSFFMGLGFLAWIISFVVTRKSLCKGIGLVFLPLELMIFVLYVFFCIFEFVWGNEGLCIYNPLIDTRHEKSFNPYNLPKIELGMERAEIISLIGVPISEKNNTMHYTSDGNSSYGDFAWYEFYIELKDGKASKIKSHWMYD